MAVIVLVPIVLTIAIWQGWDFGWLSDFLAEGRAENVLQESHIAVDSRFPDGHSGLRHPGHPALVGG